VGLITALKGLDIAIEGLPSDHPHSETLREVRRQLNEDLSHQLNLLEPETDPQLSFEDTSETAPV
jgi:hypothetical protein